MAVREVPSYLQEVLSAEVSLTLISSVIELKNRGVSDTSSPVWGL